ncbi:serine hydrolase [Acidipila sp. EB88]|uniref:serine hydrolase domain-containing protein n=1 Tax=Acidipila sp. EB88 TaxID=2305226 RepID=UPI0013158178|nr:serine hydrolase domain-containing protein [Acidipila sp. EB88]
MEPSDLRIGKPGSIKVTPLPGAMGGIRWKEQFQRVDQLLADAITAGAFPGAAYGVSLRGTVVGLGAVGHFTYAPDSHPVERGTSFDLASVTKALATTGMAMLLWQRGQLDLDCSLGELLPGFIVHQGSGGEFSSTERRQVTLRMLLAHCSGLPAYVRYFEEHTTPEGVLRAVLRTPLVAAPGTVEAYSDPGFILLGKALEVLADEPLAQFCQREIFAPLAMQATRFCPSAADRHSIPPTELDQSFRHCVVQGFVQDENCFVLGGASGHAGLFAPAVDVLRFAEAMLGPCRPATTGDLLFERRTVELFTHRAALVSGSSRALGWDTPSGLVSSAGSYFAPTSFGHLGYAGTSLWIDPVADIGIVLLTNRTYPERANTQIQQVRPAFHDAVRSVLDQDWTRKHSSTFD